MLKLNQDKKHDIHITIIKYVVSILLTLLTGALLIMALGESPAKAGHELIKGVFGSKVGIGTTLHWVTPCILVGLAALIADKSGVLNLGIEGQVYFGGLAAGMVGYLVDLPPVIHPIVCILAGGIAGMLWTVLPAMLRLLFNINEMISTLILNYIGAYLAEVFTLMLMAGSKNIASTSIQTPMIHDTAKLSIIIKGTSANSGLFIALALALLVHFFYKYTIKGYELRQVGANLKFAKYGGVNSVSSFLSIFLISGFIAGVCGAVETIGINYRFISKFSMNLGWEGIMIARIAGNSPIGLIFVAGVWGALKTGSLAIERGTIVSRYVVNLLQALFVLFVSINFDMMTEKVKNAFHRGKTRKAAARRN